VHADGIARGHDSTTDDVIAVQERSRNRLADSVNVDGWGRDEGGDEASGGRQERREHDGSEPTNVETVLRAGDPVREPFPDGGLILLEGDAVRGEGGGVHFGEEIGGSGGRLLGVEIVRDKRQRGRRRASARRSSRGDREGFGTRSQKGNDDGERELHDICFDVDCDFVLFETVSKEEGTENRHFLDFGFGSSGRGVRLSLLFLCKARS